MSDLKQEYKRIGFGLDDKKSTFHYKKGSHGKDHYTKISLAVRMPDSFEYAKKIEFKGSELQIFVKGGKPKDITIYDVTKRAGDEKVHKIEEEINQPIEVVRELHIIYVWEQLADGSKIKREDFRPDTAGGGILVGTP